MNGRRRQPDSWWGTKIPRAESSCLQMQLGSSIPAKVDALSKRLEHALLHNGQDNSDSEPYWLLFAELVTKTRNNDLLMSRCQVQYPTSRCENVKALYHSVFRWLGRIIVLKVSHFGTRRTLPLPR